MDMADDGTRGRGELRRRPALTASARAAYPPNTRQHVRPFGLSIGSMMGRRIASAAGS